MLKNNIIYKEILREYEKTRDLNKHILSEKQKKVYKSVPEIYEIDQKINLTGIKIAKTVLQNKSDLNNLIETLRYDINSLNQRKSFLMTENGFSMDYLQLNYTCNNCKDTGFIENEKCSCFKQKLIDKAYAQSNIKDIVKTENFDYFDFRYYSTEINETEQKSPRENIQEIFSSCMKFVNSFGKEFSNLIMYGSTGLGKTFLCNCIAKELLDKGHTVLYVTASQLFKMIEAQKFNRTEETEQIEIIDDLMDVELLIIDDLGTEFSTILSTSELLIL